MKPSTDRIYLAITGMWTTSMLGAAVRFGVFERLEEGPATAEALAADAGIAPRGARALLHGLLAGGFVTFADGRYHNSPAASRYLAGADADDDMRPLVRLAASSHRLWSGYADIVRAGSPPPMPPGLLDDDAFWSDLSLGCVAMAWQPAAHAAARLGIADRGALDVLDAGGGPGVYAQVWLGQNPQARFTQIDFGPANAIARARVERAGFGDRFHTIDGPLQAIDLGEARYDVIVLAGVACGLSPDENRALYARFRRALRKGGALAIISPLFDEGGRHHPVGLLLESQMLLSTPGGEMWREADYRPWLAEAGFAEVTVEPIGETCDHLIHAR